MHDQQLISTRGALHGLAEHLLAADLWTRTGKIGLRRTTGGFGQPEVLVDGERHRLRIDGTTLVVLSGDIERSVELSDAAAAAAFVGAELGAPTQVFTPESTLEPAAPLPIDAVSAAVIADWFELVEVALEEVRRRHAADSPTIPQLWPEHFDLAFSMSEVNVGGSPGDGAHDEPYLYVGPWSPVVGDDWNEPWGMSRGRAEVSGVHDAVEFFELGLAAARALSG